MVYRHFHTQNRARLIEGCKGGLLVFAGYDSMQLSGDMQAVFLQESSFWWLTGIEEPGWKVIIDGTNHGRTILFRPDESDVQKIFDGSLDDQSALSVSGADAVLPIAEFDRELRRYRRSHPLVKTLVHSDQGAFVHNPAPANLNKMLERIFTTLEDCTGQVHALRAIKQPEEIDRIRKAVAVTVEAFAAIKESLNTLRFENEIEAEFTYRFRRENTYHAYAPIVAAGGNACTLHYDKNDAPLAKRQPVLIDIGARVGGYSADITRTYCVNPTKRMIAVHAALEKAHHRCIELLGPDLLVSEYIASVDEIMKDALQEVGLLDDRGDSDTYRKYFPHAISHGLGVDTHDSLGRPRYFKPGMVLTVEPGIYIPEEQIGIRIEDDILITADGHENLSGALSTKLT